MSRETIGVTPFEKMRVGQKIQYPIERRETVNANLVKVRLKYQERKYLTVSGEALIYIIRDK
ncbi:hypothetical protein CE91St14_03490 [Porphyromonas somerae]|nr:hypothetical protein CE91St14_03490 [Porphyromonas somerae]